MMDAQAGLGKALIQLKRYPEAAGAMEEPIKIDPKLASHSSVSFPGISCDGADRRREKRGRGVQRAESGTRRRTRPGRRSEVPELKVYTAGWAAISSFSVCALTAAWLLAFHRPCARYARGSWMSRTRPGLSAFRNVQGDADAKPHILEVMGGGAAFLDYNNDGNLDILLVRGSTIDKYRRDGGDPVCALYRGDGKGHFTDVTKQCRSGELARLGHGRGRRGLRQRRLAGYLRNRLRSEFSISQSSRRHVRRGCGKGRSKRRRLEYRRGLWRFRSGRPSGSICQQLSGISARPSAGTRFFLQLPRHFRFLWAARLARAPATRSISEMARAIFTIVQPNCRSIPDKLYGLGVVIADYDNDGWPDIFVTNDLSPNLLYHNLGKRQV